MQKRIGTKDSVRPILPNVITIDRLYAPLMNASAGAPKETVLLMTSVGSTIDHMLDWYRNFEGWLKWKDIGTAMNDVERARRIGESIR